MADEAPGAERRLSREEGLTKNPIRDRMLLDRAPVARDELHEIVARARDFFHSFIGQTVHRSHKRATIYLVDDWVTDALGYFTRAGGAALDAAEGHGGAHFTEGAFVGSTGSAFAGVIQIFTALRAYRESLRGLSVIWMPGFEDAVVKACSDVLAQKAHPEIDDAQTRLLAALAAGEADAATLRSLLSQSVQLQARVNVPFFEGFTASTADLRRAVEDFLHGATPVLSGVSFDAGGVSGLLLEDIPELDIQAPAIVLAPARIARWSEGAPLGRSMKLDPALWYGARGADSLGFAVALGNVLQHEMTHAMLRLPKDNDDRSCAGSQDLQYRRSPGFEEGIANFVACLTTLATLVKSRTGVKGAAMPDLNTRAHKALYAEFGDLIAWTYADYHDRETKAFLGAWEKMEHDVRAFGGLLAMFATRHRAINWEHTLHQLADGSITTASVISSFSERRGR
jgi:hypothetical protein